MGSNSRKINSKQESTHLRECFLALAEDGGFRSYILQNIPFPLIGYVLQNPSVTVQKQRTVLFFHCVRIPQYSFIQNKKALTYVNAFSFWRRMGDSNPRARKGKRFSRPPRYDHFDNPPCIVTERFEKWLGCLGKRIHCALHRRSRSNPPCPYDLNIIAYFD